jgi:hypothetical protein
VPELVSHLHLPVQSGSDRILALMKRGHTTLEYKSIIRRLREARPDICISSDFIVGFPGETDEDFAATMALIEELGFDQSFSFIYSARPGTPAAALPDDVSLREKQHRLAILQRRITEFAANTTPPWSVPLQRVLVDRPRAQGHKRARGPHREQPRGQFRRAGASHRRFRRGAHQRRAAQLAARRMAGRRTRGRRMSTAAIEIALEPADNERLANLCGQFDENLRLLERRTGVEIGNRGNQFKLVGEHDVVVVTERVIRQLYSLTGTRSITGADVHLELRNADMSGEEEFDDSLGSIRTRRTMVKARGVNQRKYLDAIRHDINFGIGPAGTGKTYLAVACAVEALERTGAAHLLVRPAVEAGERLGFLPGDLSQKIDPYLRPLYDALYEMLGFERVAKLIERNVIEVAPLAFMRGRTLNEPSSSSTRRRTPPSSR